MVGSVATDILVYHKNYSCATKIAKEGQKTVGMTPGSVIFFVKNEAVFLDSLIKA